jgi:hypothetical protein
MNSPIGWRLGKSPNVSRLIESNSHEIELPISSDWTAIRHAARDAMTSGKLFQPHGCSRF